MFRRNMSPPSSESRCVGIIRIRLKMHCRRSLDRPVVWALDFNVAYSDTLLIISALVPSL
jgi:hypothetical protein